MPTADHRPLASTLFLLVAAAGMALHASPSEAGIVSRHAAEQAGLVRAWFTQAPLDPATQTVAGAVVHDGAIFVLTSAGTLQAMDAETGAVRWTQRLGGAHQPSYGPAIRRDVKTSDQGDVVTTNCAVIVGSTLYVLDAVNGEFILTTPIDGAPIAAPALGPKNAYIPVARGRLVGYPLDSSRGVKFRVASPGLLASAPVVAERRVLWHTTRGEVYAAPTGGGGSNYRFDATAPLSGTPILDGETMYLATELGVVHAMLADQGRSVWRTSVGGLVHRRLVSVAGMIFAVTDSPTIYALDAASGKQQWSVVGLGDFVAASAQRVYAVTLDGALGVLDLKTGRPLASWPAAGPLHPIVNNETDRLYFVSATGLIQCFHEEANDKPYRHDGVTEEEASDEPEAATEPVEEAPADEPEAPLADPFADEPAEEPAGEDPFGDFEGGAVDDDPFADF